MRNQSLMLKSIISYVKQMQLVFQYTVLIIWLIILCESSDSHKFDIVIFVLMVVFFDVGPNSVSSCNLWQNG
jgi:hypothetical protein